MPFIDDILWPASRSSGRFLDQLARVGPEALDQNPQAAPREELRLAGLAILLRRVSVDDE
jgi:hypothetical protein